MAPLNWLGRRLMAVYNKKGIFDNWADGPDNMVAAIRAEFPGVTDFEREFPSLCFALATGVGKTRLMGAFVSYLYLAAPD